MPTFCFSILFSECDNLGDSNNDSLIDVLDVILIVSIISK